MAIFTGTTRSNGYDPAYESYGNAIGGGMDALIEGFSDELAVIEAMHALDMAEIELAKKVRSIRESAESEEEEVDVEEEIKEAEESYVVATEASMKDIWAKIKAWFKKLWEKVKAFFAGLLRNIAAFVLTPKAFLNQYRSKLTSIKNFKVTVKTYKYDQLKSVVDTMVGSVKKAFNEHNKSVDDWVNVPFDNAKSHADNPLSTTGTNERYLKVTEDLDDAQEKIVKDFLKDVIGNDNSDEFSENVYKKLRGGTDREEITITDLKPYIDIIDYSAVVVNTLKNVDKMVNEYCNKLNNKINTEAKAAEKSAEDKDMTVASRRAALMRKSISGYTRIQSFVNRFVSISTSVVREACGASKAILNAAMSPKAMKK